jgi:hypothetical protein
MKFAKPPVPNMLEFKIKASHVFLNASVLAVVSGVEDKVSAHAATAKIMYTF